VSSAVGYLVDSATSPGGYYYIRQGRKNAL